MSLVEHAKRELELCGQAAKDPGYAASLVAAVAAFASYGHSGGSASVAIGQLHRLLQFENLSPLTSDPDEWIDRSKESGYPFWQNKRNSKAFSRNGGRDWYLLGDEETQPTGLRAQLRHLILARQKRAEAATPGSWISGESFGVTGVWQGTPEEDNSIFGAHHRSDRAWGGSDEDRAHIAAEDPIFVLRQCARDLSVLDRHVQDTDKSCIGCGFDSQEERREQWPCPEVLDLAEAYGIVIEDNDDGS